jgi:hypothetical protein
VHHLISLGHCLFLIALPFLVRVVANLNEKIRTDLINSSYLFQRLFIGHVFARVLVEFLIESFNE